MKRPWQIWTIFSVALAVVLSALGWMTSQAVRLEQVERERDREETISLRKNARYEKIALRDSELEENVGPALWLMASTHLAPPSRAAKSSREAKRPAAARRRVGLPVAFGPFTVHAAAL